MVVESVFDPSPDCRHTDIQLSNNNITAKESGRGWESVCGS